MNFCSRVGREHEFRHRTVQAGVLFEERFRDERAVLPEHLHAVVDAVAHVNEPVLGETHAVHGPAELRGRWLRRIVRRCLLVAGRLAVRAPVPLVGARLRVEHDDAPVAVAVRDVDFFRRNVDVEVGRAAEIRGVVAAFGLAALADLQHEFAVEREFEYLRILVAAAGRPHEIVVVDEYPVLDFRPFVTRAGAAPRAQQVAGIRRTPIPAAPRNSICSTAGSAARPLRARIASAAGG